MAIHPELDNKREAEKRGEVYIPVGDPDWIKDSPYDYMRDRNGELVYEDGELLFEPHTPEGARQKRNKIEREAKERKKIIKEEIDVAKSTKAYELLGNVDFLDEKQKIQTVVNARRVMGKYLKAKPYIDVAKNAVTGAVDELKHGAKEAWGEWLNSNRTIGENLVEAVSQFSTNVGRAMDHVDPFGTHNTSIHSTEFYQNFKAQQNKKYTDKELYEGRYLNDQILNDNKKKQNNVNNTTSDNRPKSRPKSMDLQTIDGAGSVKRRGEGLGYDKSADENIPIKKVGSSKYKVDVDAVTRQGNTINQQNQSRNLGRDLD